MRVVGIIQARMGSHRFPGKVLTSLCGRPLLFWLMVRMKACQVFHDLVLAIPEGSEEDPLEDLGRSLGVSVFRGAQEDVLDRYYWAAWWSGADVVVRITGDNPLTDPEIVDRALWVHLSQGLDYTLAKNRMGIPRGLGVEILSFPTLEWLWEAVQDPQDREHVTLYLLRHPTPFRCGAATGPAFFPPPGLSLTVDEPEDLARVEALCRRLGKTPDRIRLADIGALGGEPAFLFAASSQSEEALVCPG